jgi:hypothetical protein
MDHDFEPALPLRRLFMKAEMLIKAARAKAAAPPIRNAVAVSREGASLAVGMVGSFLFCRSCGTTTAVAAVGSARKPTLLGLAGEMSAGPEFSRCRCQPKRACLCGETATSSAERNSARRRMPPFTPALASAAPL